MRRSWRKVRRAPAGYWVFSEGEIRSPGGPLTPQTDRDGYRRVKIRGEWVPVSHLVLEAFVGPRPFGTEACHGPSGNSVDTVTNLRWDTHLENIRDKRRAGKPETEVGTYPVRSETASHGGQQ